MISLDNWSSYVHNMMDIDIPIIGVIYGLVIVILGSYVVMNLILAVIIDTFIKLHEEDMRKDLLTKEGTPLEIIVKDIDINVAAFDALKKKIQHEIQVENKKKEEIMRSSAYLKARAATLTIVEYNPDVGKL